MFNNARLIQCLWTFTHFSFYLLPVQTEECLNNSTLLQMRIFEDLLDLQGNKYPFSVDSVGFLGNDLIFKSIRMPIIPKNAFVVYDSGNIRRIALNGKHVRRIAEGAFYRLDCLVTLDLSNNKISTITKRVFQGLDYLHELDISNNWLEDFPEEVFTLVSRLRKLSLAHNRLRELKPDSFFKLWLLEELDLSNNYLQRISSTTLQYLRSLINFQLGSNELEDLEVDRWEIGIRLKVLNVSNNALENFDLSFKYSFRRSLTELYINQNYITGLFLTGFKKRFPNLKMMDLNDNLWNCTNLFRIIEKFNASGVKYPGNAESHPNINKIACDRPKVVKQKPLWDTSEDPNIGTNDTDKIIEEIELTQHELADSISTVEAILVCLVVVGSVYIVASVVLKMQFARGCRRRGNYTEIESVALVSGRFRST